MEKIESDNQAEVGAAMFRILDKLKAEIVSAGVDDSTKQKLATVVRMASGMISNILGKARSTEIEIEIPIKGLDEEAEPETDINLDHFFKPIEGEDWEEKLRLDPFFKPLSPAEKDYYARLFNGLKGKK